MDSTAIHGTLPLGETSTFLEFLSMSYGRRSPMMLRIFSCNTAWTRRDPVSRLSTTFSNINKPVRDLVFRVKKNWNTSHHGRDMNYCFIRIQVFQFYWFIKKQKIVCKFYNRTYNVNSSFVKLRLVLVGIYVEINITLLNYT